MFKIHTLLTVLRTALAKVYELADVTATSPVTILNAATNAHSISNLKHRSVLPPRSHRGALRNANLDKGRDR